MREPVLDASVLLAFAKDEDGARLPDAFHVGAVNWSEVLQWAPPGADAGVLLDSFRGLGMTLHPFDRQHAAEAARLHKDPVLRRLGLGDRACLALARVLHAPAWTADRSWAEAKTGVRLHFIR